MAERKKIKTKEDYDAPENSPGTHQLTERFEKLSFKNRAKAKLVIFSLVVFSRRFCFFIICLAAGLHVSQTEQQAFAIFAENHYLWYSLIITILNILSKHFWWSIVTITKGYDANDISFSFFVTRYFLFSFFREMCHGRQTSIIKLRVKRNEPTQCWKRRRAAR